MKKYVFGIDIGGTAIKIGLFDSQGTIIEKWEIDTRKENNGKYIFPDIADKLDQILIEKDISKLDIEGIGIGVPGPVTEDGTVIKCVNLGWGIINVEREFEKMTGLRVKASNDANVAALGEMWQGGGKGYKNVVMVTIGTGVGGGMVIDGKVVSGAHGASGEIGHINISHTEEEQCNCGNYGCLEQYASATGIVRLAKRIYESDSLTIKNSSNYKTKYATAKSIIDEAKKGDEIGLKVIEEAGGYLGKALAQIACIVNPDIFVIGGGVSKAGDILLDVIKKNFKQYVFHAARDTKFALATLGNDAGIYGSVYLLGLVNND